MHTSEILEIVRTTLELSKQEMSNLLGVPGKRYARYESGVLIPDDFFYERMETLYGIDMRQSGIAFAHPEKLKPAVYEQLRQLLL
ncbi:helix-turn-helix domain-containing protein [Chitinophaga polysaccharea]|uniref:helix-turn-helix transcriptional regulator n=1 Tax=Chitinophaga polysaccharea TaxID=1293035 RepID=UPI001455ABE0|nr:helix-turn-helix transcriptional regulator [Chitinophaga polysaccharea]NLR56553.1 helix-turn-helix domain-containing protein [Chitinophaga polysaccharea]